MPGFCLPFAFDWFREQEQPMLERLAVLRSVSLVARASHNLHVAQTHLASVESELRTRRYGGGSPVQVAPTVSSE